MYERDKKKNSFKQVKWRRCITSEYLKIDKNPDLP